MSTPSGQQSCGGLGLKLLQSVHTFSATWQGEYLLVAGETANGSPLWKQMGGKYWLYSGDVHEVSQVQLKIHGLQDKSMQEQIIRLSSLRSAAQEPMACGLLEEAEPKGTTSTAPVE